MFGESVFAFIPDHEVRAAKLANRWISGWWWRRDASSDEHLVGTKFGDVEMDTGIPGPALESRRDEGMPSATAQEEIPSVPPPAPPPQTDSHVPEVRRQGVHAKALRIRAFWSEIGRTPGCLARETPGPGKSHTRESKTYQDAWDESRRTAAAEEAKRGVAADPDTRPLEPKRTKTITEADTENSTDQMNVENFQRTPATSHPLERGEDKLKFDVNEEAWPNADLAIHSSYEGALIDGLPADKVEGWR